MAILEKITANTTLPIEAQPSQTNCSSPPSTIEIFYSMTLSDVTPATNKPRAIDINPIILKNNWNFLKIGTSVLSVNIKVF